MQQVKLGRKELYDLVWSKPLMRLAKELWVSDVGLRKICKRLSIPTPPVGYWRRLERGLNPVKPALTNPEQVGRLWKFKVNEVDVWVKSGGASSGKKLNYHGRQ